MAVRKILVRVGALARQLKSFRVNADTTLVRFATAHKLALNSNIRVNGAIVKKTYVLKNGDILTVVGNVSGGK